MVVLVYINEIKGSLASLYLPWLPFSVYKLITINYQLFFIIIFFHLKYPATAMMT